MSEPLYIKSVPIRAFGKARPRVTRNGTHMPTKYIAQRDELRWHCADMPDMANKRLILYVRVYRAMPQSWSEKKRDAERWTYNTTMPDIDNIVGAVMDALFDNDSAVVMIFGWKRWGDKDAIGIEIHQADDRDIIPF